MIILDSDFKESIKKIEESEDVATEEIEEEGKKYIEGPIISEHIFMLPFTIKEFFESSHKDTYEIKKHENLRKGEEKFVNALLKNKRWKENTMVNDRNETSCSVNDGEADLTNREMYMLKQYLSESGRQIFMKSHPSLFRSFSMDLSDDIKENCSTKFNINSNQENSINEKKSKYQYTIEKNEFEIDPETGEKKPQPPKKYEYTLDIISINMHLYNVGCGVLLIQVRNNFCNSIQDVKRINDWGRRMYSPIVGNNALCADSIGITCSHGRKITTQIGNSNTGNVMGGSTLGEIPDFIKEIFNGTICDKIPPTDISGAYNMIVTVPDDRMFVQCLICAKKIDEKCKESGNYTECEKEISDLMYSIFFVTAGKSSCPAFDAGKKYLEKTLYRRWATAGTFHGITNYSAICLTEAKIGIMESVYRPFFTEYTYIISLVLMQKITLTTYSYLVGKILSLDKKPLKKHITRYGYNLKRLQDYYVKFKNQYMILEISHQEQGIEMYDMLQENMLVIKEEKILTKQIQEVAAADSTERGLVFTLSAQWLAFMGFAFTIYKFLKDVFGATKLHDILREWPLRYILILGIAVLLACAVIKIIKLLISKKI